MELAQIKADLLQPFHRLYHKIYFNFEQMLIIDKLLDFL
jgi:hypothetical protein